jgi:hypothetical protein
VPVEDVADLLERWRHAGGVWSRSRVLAESANRLGRLSPDERRVLASALAEGGLPELVAPLRPDLPVRLEPHHVQTVVDGLLALDGDEIDDLVAVLRDPDQVRARAYEALRDLPPPPAPPPGYDPAHLPPPGSTRPRRPEGRTAPEIGDRGDEVPASEEVPSTVGSAAAVDTAPTTGVARAAGVQNAADVPSAAAAPKEVPNAAGVHSRSRDVAPGPSPSPEMAAAVTDPVHVDVLDELRRASSPTARRRVLAQLRGQQLPGEEVVRLLDEVPDGWQRRRVTLQLLDLGALDTVPGATVLGRLGRAADRRFAAGALLDAGLLTPGELPGLVPPSTARWLSARARR